MKIEEIGAARKVQRIRGEHFYVFWKLLFALRQKIKMRKNLLRNCFFSVFSCLAILKNLSGSLSVSE